MLKKIKTNKKQITVVLIQHTGTKKFIEKN